MYEAEKLNNFRCVQCHREVGASDAGLECRVCGCVYPSINDIDVLVINAEGLLSAQLKWSAQRRQDIDNKKRELTSLFAAEDASAQQSLSLLNSSLDGTLANVELIDEIMSPVRRYLAGRPAKKGLLDDFTVNGWPVGDLLPYFYRDWRETAEGDFLRELFARAFEKHCGDNMQSLAVLGCGACGLVHQASHLFRQVYGIELSIDTLLMAQRFLEGREVALHFNFPRDDFPLIQKVVALKGAAAKRHNVRLLVADANQLPFNSSSLSCVVTQYMMDIMPDQSHFAREVRRVLAPGGVWLNFSIPGYLSSQDQLTHLDLQRFSQHAGFDLLEASLQRYTHLDLSDLSEWGVGAAHTPILFALKKNESQEVEQHDLFAEYFAGEGSSLMEQTPRLTIPITISHERQFQDQKVSQQKIIVIQRSGKTTKLQIPSQLVDILSWFLQKIDGRNSVRQIIEALHANYGKVIDEREAIMFFRQLSELAIITL